MEVDRRREPTGSSASLLHDSEVCTQTIGNIPLQLPKTQSIPLSKGISIVALVSLGCFTIISALPNPPPPAQLADPSSSDLHATERNANPMPLAKSQTTFDNSCLMKQQLLPPTPNAPQTFLPDCAAWVINTTDLVWNTKLDVNKTLEQYFDVGFEAHGSFGRMYKGMEALKAAVASTQSAFPDLKIHISDSYCVGNDIDGYKTVMPDVLIGTNTGPSAYGPATGKRVAYQGLAITYIQRVEGEWKYVAEWVLHDELSLISQLGLDPSAISNLPRSTPHPEPNCDILKPTFGWHSWGPAVPAPAPQAPAPAQVTQPVPVIPQWSDNQDLPLSKRIVRAMDKLIIDHVSCFDWDGWSAVMDQFWTQDMVYDTNWTPNSELLGRSVGMRQWFDQEHIPWNTAFTNVTFNQLLVIGEDATAATTTYANAVFSRDFGPITATGKPVTVRIWDFYQISVEQQQISTNWMLLDLPDLMLQAGHRVLPKSQLREGWVQGPRAMDGNPAPISELSDPAHADVARQVVQDVLDTQWTSNSSLPEHGGCGLWADDMIWYGPSGVGTATSCSEYHQHFLQPLYAAFPRRAVVVDVLTCEGRYCGAHGVMRARHMGPWLGAEASGREVELRFGMHFHVNVERRQVVDAWALFDIPHCFSQMGIDLFARFTQMQKTSSDLIKR